MSKLLPLRGLRVLDFTSLLPGPYATQILADLGANVLRVESPNRPDLARITAPFIRENVSAIHGSLNRNKQSIALNLKEDASTDIINDLVKNHSYDIIIEGFRPGVMKKLNLDFNKLKKMNPGLIYVSITGYGQYGKYSKRAGHDINYLALSGLASYNENGPTLLSTQVADIAGGSHHAVIGLLSAVVARQTAISQNIDLYAQHVDISMADAAFALNVMGAATTLFTEKSPIAGSEVLNGGNPCYGYYQTKDKKYLSVGALEPQFAIMFFETIGKVEWVQRLAGVMVLNTTEDAEELRNDIAEVINKKTLKQWVNIFQNVDCCVEPVLNVLEASKHPLFVERNMICDVHVDKDDTDIQGNVKAETIKQVASAIKFSNSTSREKQWAGNDVGHDTTSILMKQLGYAKIEIDELKKGGVIV